MDGLRSSSPVIELRNVLSFVRGPRDLFFELDKRLRVEYPGAEYARQHKPGFDGFYHPLDLLHGSFPTGLAQRVRGLLPTAAVVDKRIRPAHKPLDPDICRGITLNEYQLAGLMGILETPPEFVVPGRGVAGLGVGCHPAGTRILMFDGTTKAVEKIQLGDQLMGPDSRPRTVLRLIEGTGNLFQVQPIKGVPWDANENHVLTLVRTPRSAWPKYPSEAGGQVVDVPLHEWLTWPKHRKQNHKLWRVSVDFPNSRPLPVDPYFVGALLGDGCLLQEPRITKGDPEIQALAEAEAAKWGLSVKVDLSSSGCPTYRITGGGTGGKSNPLTVALRKLGLMGRGSATKFIPQDYKLASRADRLALLAGLLDTDGSLAHGCFDFVSQSEVLAKDAAFVARSLGFAAQVVPAKKRDQNGNGGTYWRFCVSGDTSLIPTRIPRKKAAVRRQRKNVLRTGFDVVPHGHGRYFGFTLDGDGRYLLDDFTVTHNSGKTELGISLALHVTGKCVVVVHRKDLLAQWVERIKLRTGEDAAMIGDGQWDERAGQALTKFIVVIPNTALQDMELFRAHTKDANVLVLDEVHRTGGAATWFRIAQSVPAYYRLGLTGTPETGDPVRDLRLEAAAGPILIRVRAAELAKAGLLVPVRVLYHRIINPPTGGETIMDVRRKLIEDNEGRNLKIVSLVRESAAIGKPCLVICDTKRHVRRIAEILRGVNVRVRILTGDNKTRVRVEAKAGLRSGALEAVLCTSIWDDGQDIPELETVILAAGGKSAVRCIQRIGRVIRKSDGKTEGIVHDFYDTGNRYMTRHSLARIAACRAEGFKIVGTLDQLLATGKEPES